MSVVSGSDIANSLDLDDSTTFRDMDTISSMGDMGDREDLQDFMEYEPIIATSCQYCGIQAINCLIQCMTCNKWFCNSKANANSSHIVTHLTLSRHNTVSTHKDSDLGDTTLECYSCNKTNVFNLGYISAKQDQVVVILCRLPCSQMKDMNWDSASWKPLIEDRVFLPWLASSPNEDELLSARTVTHEDILKLESNWRLNRDGAVVVEDTEKVVQEVLPTLMRYTDGFQYQKCFAPLIQLEADYDKELKESQALEHIQVTWDISLTNRHTVAFTLSTFDSGVLKFAVGDEIIVRYNELNEPAWEGHGYIIRLPSAVQEYFTIELLPSLVAPPTDKSKGFTAEFVWKGTSFNRMQSALVTFATKEESISSYLYHKILGHDVNLIEFDIEIPKNLNAPGLTRLNDSQLNAVGSVLKRPFSLIQGPPGTGKTLTSATIIYHLQNLNKGQKILVCAPSNVAVDHLASKLHSIGLKVVRLLAKSREDIESETTDLSLHSLVTRSRNEQLKRLMKLKETKGELSQKDTKTYQKLLYSEETKILNNTDIICCTCMGAGDGRLSKYKFRTVLIDESTQATEPESLIPLVKGCRQVILVGDHQQLGPIVVQKQAADCGLQQSLFERLITLGHVPIRLEVQYRMNPFLSEFPSNMFYEGSLQDGVTIEQRLIENSMFPWPIANVPMFFWGNYGKEEISASGSSFLNRVEAMNIEKTITRLFKDGISPDQIGVITPYEGQRAFITQYLSLNCTILDKKLEYLKVEVTSVDAFQGREKDFIILSCVRANEQQNIGFLRDPRRLNVALTRAKYGLIILGDTRSLSKNVLWNHLLLHFREKGCLVDGTLENLKLSTTPLTTTQSRRPAAALLNSTVNSMAESMKSLNTHELHWPELNKPINSNFHSKLNKLNQEYSRNNPKVNEDDIKSITSSFIDGFNLN